MMLKKWQRQSINLSCALTLALVSCSDRTLAQTPLSDRIGEDTPPFQQPLEFEPPPDGAPGDRKDTGSRPGCPQVEKPFMALVPATNLGVTVSEYPTFWLYVPYRLGVAELVLEDETTQSTVYRTRFQVTDGSGIISFRLPSTAPGLEMGKKYRWRYFFFCNPASESDFLTVNGVVKRVLLDDTLRSQLEGASPLERVKLYAQNGLWHEALTELAQLRLANPEDAEIAAAWLALMQHPMVRLDEIVSEPLVSCCRSEK